MPDGEVIVIGGGYGGIRLARQLDEYARVTLVDRKEVFFHRIAALRAGVQEEWTTTPFIPYDRLLANGRVMVATGLTSLRTQMDEFRKGLGTAFREDIADPCWFHSEINVARLMRHALSHNGGRQTEDLKKLKHGIKLIGEDLQIVPENNHRMLRRLRKAVEKVIEVTRDDPKFMAPAAKLPQPREDHHAGKAQAEEPGRGEPLRWRSQRGCRRLGHDHGSRGPSTGCISRNPSRTPGSHGHRPCLSGHTSCTAGKSAPSYAQLAVPRNSAYRSRGTSRKRTG